MPDDLPETELGAACALLRLIRDTRPTEAAVRAWRSGAGAALYPVLCRAGVVAVGPDGRLALAGHTAGGLVAVGGWVVQFDTGSAWPLPRPDKHAEPGAAADRPRHIGSGDV